MKPEFKLASLILWAITLVLLESGCSPKYYVPPQHNIPMLANGGEGKVGT